jgi:glutamate racemase
VNALDSFEYLSPFERSWTDGLSMHDYDLVFCDSCVGGSTVASRVVEPESGVRALYLADYAINPLGRRPPIEVNRVVRRWIEIAENHADTLVIACNTASISLYETGPQGEAYGSRALHIISMVDLLDRALARVQPVLSSATVCLLGTEFTVSCQVYQRRLIAAGALTVRSVAATRTESVIARLDHLSPRGTETIVAEIGDAVRTSDVVVLACTCFPLIVDVIRTLNPGCVVIDPAEGGALPGYLPCGSPNRLTIVVTGNSCIAGVDSFAALFKGWYVDRVIPLPTNSVVF